MSSTCQSKAEDCSLQKLFVDVNVSFVVSGGIYFEVKPLFDRFKPKKLTSCKQSCFATRDSLSPNEKRKFGCIDTNKIDFSSVRSV